MRRKYVLLWNGEGRIPSKFKAQIERAAGMELIKFGHKYAHVEGGDFVIQTFAGLDERWEAYAGVAE